MAYTYDIKYKPTALHGNADGLSRLPMGSNPEFDREIDSETCLVVDSAYQQVLNDQPIDEDVIRKHQMSDKLITEVVEFIQKGWPEVLNKDQARLIPYFNRRFCLNIFKNILLLQTEYIRVVIPQTLRNEVLLLLHQGHWGQTRMKQLARRHCWWPGVDKDIENMVNQCDVCQNEVAYPKREYSAWPAPNKPWERIHIDYAGPFFDKMWLICVDAYSRFPYIYELSLTTSTKTIQCLQEIFAIEGLPETLISDNGPQFTSIEFEQFCIANGIQHLRTAPFHPESNGEAERFVRTFKGMFNKEMTAGSNKDRALIKFLSTYRATPNSSGKSPSELLHGRQHRSLLSLLLPCMRQKTEINATHKFNLNQLVYVRNFSGRKKWLDGKIIEVIGRRMYLVATSWGNVKRHQNQIRKRGIIKSVEGDSGSHQNFGKMLASTIPNVVPTEMLNIPVKNQPVDAEIQTGSISTPLRRSMRIRKEIVRFQS